MSSWEGERDKEVLEEIAERFGTSPEELIEGKSDIYEFQVSDRRLDLALLCTYTSFNCYRIVGCENSYCGKHPQEHT